MEETEVSSEKEKTMTMRTKNGKKGDRYLDLVLRYPLRPIRSDTELDRAIAMIDYLIDQDRLQSEERDYLDVLSDLVERYETDYHPIPSLSDGEILQHLIQSNGISQAVVARESGIAESTISEVIGGTRKLSRVHIGKLCRFFGVQPGAFNFDT
jgi:HTH-type transcriptional regulator / antitoxin HigA